MFKGVPFARTKATTNMQSIAPMCSPTIGNTLVEPNQQAENFCILPTVPRLRFAAFRLLHLMLVECDYRRCV